MAVSSSKMQRMLSSRSHVKFVERTEVMIDGSLQERLIIDGQSYSLDDASVVENMSQEERELFWGSCSDKGKDNNLYRIYANHLLHIHNVNIDTVQSADLRLIIVNHAKNVVDLQEFFYHKGRGDWLTRLGKKPQLLKLCIENPEHMRRLLQEFYKLGESMIRLLKHSSLKHLRVMVDKPYDTVAFLEDLLKLKLGYDKNKVLKAFLAVNLEQFKLLLNKRHHSLDLLKVLFKAGIGAPLDAIATLDTAKLALLIEHHDDVLELIQALSMQNQLAPFSYLTNLSLQALTVIFASQAEYLKKIAEGVDLSQEFKPITAANVFRPVLSSYIKMIRDKPSFLSRVEGLDIPSGLLINCCDVYTRKMANVPVRLDGDLFDLDTLEALKPDLEGLRTNPLNQQKFTLSDLQPAREVAKECIRLISEAEANLYNTSASSLRPS